MRTRAVSDALTVLQQRRLEDARNLRRALRAAIKVGVDELERGDFLELDAAELRVRMNLLGTRRRPRGR